MLRPVHSLCFFCEARAFLQPPKPAAWAAKSQGYATKQLANRRPARLQLSKRVSQAPERLSPRGKPMKQSRSSPFASMNKTKANVREPEQPQRTERGRAGSRKQPEKSARREGDFKALKMQRALASVSYDRRGSIRDRIVDVDSFGEYPLLPVVQEALVSNVLPSAREPRPTPIQRVALPALLGTGKGGKKPAKLNAMQQYLLAAETGSGKTLAYLLPIVDAIKRAEIAEAEQGAQSEASDAAQRKADQERREASLFEVEFPEMVAEDQSKAGKPRAIILVPTAELVQQVTSLAKLLCHTVKFRVQGISAADSPTVIKKRLFNESGIDMLVSTPHLLASIAETERTVLSKVTHLVIDEADSLLDRSFVKETTPIIDRSSPTLKQLIMCSATIPRSLDSFLRTRYPDLHRLVTPNLHAIPRRVQLGVVDVEKDPYRGNKSLACADTIWTIGKSTDEHTALGDDALAGLETEKEKVSTKRIIVFVNERETAREVSDYLMSRGIDAVALGRGTDDAQRQAEALAEFKGSSAIVPPPASPTATGSSGSDNKNNKGGIKGAQQKPSGPTHAAQATKGRNFKVLPNTKVLVATDLGSRGIDTTAVRHVILYDVPHSTIDFIHRLGRTGRMGRRGRGIVLVGKGDRRDVVREVREGMYMGKALI